MLPLGEHTLWPGLSVSNCDDHVVKLNLDFSCGVGSLATIMEGFYGLKVDEEEILLRMESDGTTSFQNLSDVAWEYNYSVKELAL
jgi:predicted double-glycine peptidase